MRRGVAHTQEHEMQGTKGGGCPFFHLSFILSFCGNPPAH